MEPCTSHNLNVPSASSETLVIPGSAKNNRCCSFDGEQTILFLHLMEVIVTIQRHSGAGKIIPQMWVSRHRGAARSLRLFNPTGQSAPAWGCRETTPNAALGFTPKAELTRQSTRAHANLAASPQPALVKCLPREA